MNTIAIQLDLPRRIFYHLDGTSLFKSMQVCRLFARIINKIIINAEHNDTLKHLFQIATLSIDTMRKYSQQISAFNDGQIAGLILAACVHNHFDFISSIVSEIARFRPMTKESQREQQLKNAYYEIYFEFIFFNNFFDLIPHEALVELGKMVCLENYLDTWFVMISNGDRIDIIDRMYDLDHLIKYKIFDRIYNIVSDTGTANVELNIKNAMYTGEVNIFDHYRIMCADEIPSYINDKMDEFMVYTLYGGHVQLFVDMVHYKSANIQNYYKHIIVCLLRCNHIDHYQIFLSTVTDPYFQVINQNIGLNDIFISLPAIDTIVLPRLSLTTFEFCMKNFGIEAKLPNCAKYTTIASDEICQKYLSDNYIVEKY